MPATSDLLDGVDTTWNRVPGGAEIARVDRRDDRAIQCGRPSRQRARPAGDPPPGRRAPRRSRRERQARSSSIGSSRRASVSRSRPSWIAPRWCPARRLKMRHTAVVRSRIPVRWTAVRYPSVRRAIDKVRRAAPEPAGRPSTPPRSCPPPRRRASRTGCASEGTAGLFHVDDPSLIGRAENPPAFPIEYVFDVGGQTLVVSGEPVPADGSREARPAPPAGRHPAGLAALHRRRAALRARRRAAGDGGAHRRPRARRRHRAARGARRAGR